MINKVGIIGGGASGMVAAIIAARRGLEVTIFEQQDELGKKILATGNGRCNLTNLKMDSSCYYCSDFKFLDHLLKQYSVSDVLGFFASIGVLVKDREGYIYPVTDQACTVRDAFTYELDALNVSVYVETTVRKVQYVESEFKVVTNEGNFSFENIILATGGESGLHKSITSTGFGLLHDMGIPYSTLVPALVSFQGLGQFYKKIAGVRTHGTVTAVINGEPLKSDTGEIQFTKTGISGIPVFQISRVLSLGLSEGKHCSIVVDFLSEYSEDEFLELLLKRRSLLQNRTIKEFLNGIWKDKLIDLFLYTARIPEDRYIHDVTENEFKKLIRISKTFEVKLKDSDGFMKSQVTAGGLSLNNITTQLESKQYPHLYATGELLDIDGICGGYNLHLAWITGMLVGESIC